MVYQIYVPLSLAIFEDEENAATLLPLMTEFSMSKEQALYFGSLLPKVTKDEAFVVGSSATTAPIIDASYRRLLKALEAHFEQQSFFIRATTQRC